MYTLPLSPPITAPLSALPLLDHFKGLSGTHPLSVEGMHQVANAVGGTKALFGPLKQKKRAGQLMCMIDLYATMTSSYFWMVGGKDGEKRRIEPASLIWSRAWNNGKLEQGMEPFPILTAVRHERPWQDWKSKEEAFEDPERPGLVDHLYRNAWWQWMEFNPVEVGSDELEGWVPTWGFGRPFDKGVSTKSQVEHSLGLIMGICTAAPAAPLSSFLGTIWRNLPQNIIGSTFRNITKSIAKHLGDHRMDIIDGINPVHAGNEPNPFFGAERDPSKMRGNSFENSPRMHLVDSGMANNCPQHVFLHPARDCDLIILFDASSDVQKGAALTRINDYGATKGLVFTPRVHLSDLAPLKMDDEGKPIQLSAEDIAKRFDGRYAQLLDGKPHRDLEGKEGIVLNDQHQPQAWREVLLVYIPLLPNGVNPTYDPSTAPFSSSYNLVWTPEQVDSIYTTSRANVMDGLPVLKAAVKEAYERRKAYRLALEAEGTGTTKESRASRARRNVATVGTDGGPAKTFILTHVEPDPDDGTRPWME
ncbi:FabD/lysophospholipase-like protein [Meredithblackwellia eburnea MCA 4105]